MVKLERQRADPEESKQIGDNGGSSKIANETL
jgi:hypothetical protein